MNRRTHRDLATLFYLAIIGISTGFLVGLSLSPIISGVLGSVLALALSAVGALAGLKQEETAGARAEGEEEKKTRFTLPSLDVRPIAVICFTLTCGSCAGLLARSNDVFGPLLGVYIYRWHGAGLPDAELKLRILNAVGGLGTPSAALVQGEAERDIKTEHKDTTNDSNCRLSNLHPQKSKSKRDTLSYPDTAGGRRYPVAGLNASPAQPAPEECAQARNHTDIGARQQDLEQIATKFQKRFLTPVKDCHTDECVALALEVLCPSAN